MSQRVFKEGVYKGYIPARLPQHKPRNPVKPWYKVAYKEPITVYPRPRHPEWTETPQYPAFVDGSMNGRKRKLRTDWYDSLKSLPTVDEKLYEIINDSNFLVVNFDNTMPAYNSLPLVKYITRTHLINGLPVKYDKDELIDSITLERVKNALLNQIALSKYDNLQKLDVRMTITDDDQAKLQRKTNQKIQHVINAAKKALPSSPLYEAQVDFNPKIQSWWWHSGFTARVKKNFYRSRVDANDNINQIIQLISDTALNFRTDALLEPILDQSDELITDESLVEAFSYPLTHFGGEDKFMKPIMLPGHWHERVPKFDFPHTSFLSMDCLNERQSQLVANKLTDYENCLDCQAINTAFGWLNGLATYHGFTPYQEVEYPFTTQLVTTDGQRWMFHVFQMNSHSFHRDLKKTIQTKNNICWSSGLMQLYDSYEDGRFKGVNDEVVKTLIKFMLIKPSREYTMQQNLRPYLGNDERSDLDRFLALRQLKALYANLFDGWFYAHTRVPLWEKIFFRSPQMKHSITDMKPEFKIPIPPPPKHKFD